MTNVTTTPQPVTFVTEATFGAGMASAQTVIGAGQVIAIVDGAGTVNVA